MNERCQKSTRAYWRKFGGARRPLAAGRFARTGEGRMKGGEPVFGVRYADDRSRAGDDDRPSRTAVRARSRTAWKHTAICERPPASPRRSGRSRTARRARRATNGRPRAARSRTAGREPPVAHGRSERPVSGRASRGRRVAHRAARAGPIVATHAAPRPFVGRPAGSGRARPDRPLAPPARRPELSRTADTGRDAAPCPDS